MNPLFDPDLPGLAPACDLAGVIDALRAALSVRDQAIDIEKAQIVDVRYRPGRPCWVLYRLKVRRSLSPARSQFLAARLLRAAESVASLPTSILQRYRTYEDAALETPCVHLPDQHMVLYAFPVDEALPGLFDALDAGVVRRQLTAHWAPRGARVRKVAIRTLGYTPGARAALEYEVLAESSGVPEVRRLVGKMHAMKPAARRFADAWAVWRVARGRVGLAPPVGYLGRMGVTLQEHVRGVRLGALVRSPGIDARARQTARMLATLHALELPLATRRTPLDEAHTVHRWAGLLRAVRPDLASRVNTLTDEIASSLEARATVLGPVHADFHHTNVLVDGATVTIIDFDEMAYGDPLVDVGRFLASLRIPALRAFGVVSGLADARETFLDTYLARAKSSRDRSRVRLFEAAGLLIAAASAFRIQRPNWAQEVELLLGEAERVTVTARRGPATALSRMSHDRDRPVEPDVVRSWIADPIFMQANLDPFVRQAYGADVISCRPVMSVSANGRTRVKFDLDGRQGDRKWKLSLEGLAGSRRGGHALIRRLQNLHRAMQTTVGGPVLPRPVAYLRRLTLVVWEMPDGVPLSSLLQNDTAAAVKAALEAGRTLAVLHHRTIVDCDTRISLDEEIEAFQRSVARHQPSAPALLSRAARLMPDVVAACRSVVRTERPSLRRLSPHRVLWDGDRVGLVDLDRMALAHPLTDVADFLARLFLVGIERGTTPLVAEIGHRFWEAYSSTADDDRQSDLAGFEAGALLRLACAEAGQRQRARVAEQLIERAEQRLVVRP